MLNYYKGCRINRKNQNFLRQIICKSFYGFISVQCICESPQAYCQKPKQQKYQNHLEIVKARSRSIDQALQHPEIYSSQKTPKRGLRVLAAAIRTTIFCFYKHGEFSNLS